MWEYGVLRSMGLTKEQGHRMYMYEAYVIVASSSLLGLSIGLCSCILVSAQLFTFVEMPPVLMFPTMTFLGMLVIAFITTYVAVFIPMKSVNKK